MNNFTMPDPQYFLFAARRDQGQLILVNPKSGQRFLMNEELLRRDYRVQLGDFLKCRTNRARELYEISQTKHTADISTVINGDEAIVVNLKVNLISQNGLLLFQCPLFDDIRCWPVIQTGRYVITMRLLNTSREMIPGKIVHFEAVDIAAQAPNERFVNSGQKVGSGFSTTAKKPEPIVGTGFSSASRTESPKPNSTVVGKGFQRPQTPKQNTKVVGSGFPSPQKQVTPANNNKVAGSGFPKPPKKEEKIVGTGFQPSKKDKNSEKPGQIVGEGFTTSQTKEEKQRAVVTSIDEKRPGLYYLWNLDSKTEGLFKTTKYVLALGHHFEGTFQKQEDGRCVCKEYKGPITELLHGGINDKEKLFLTVKITKFTPAGVNQKFSTGTAKYIGELLEGRTDETKLTAGCIGKTVKIERRRVGEKDYVWMVTKIL